MFGFPNYPRGNTDITNLDYILNELKSQGEKIESWIQFSQIKFADPIDWNINTTYKAYTIVLAPDFNSYISKRDVSGHAYIDYTNTDFWYKIGNYNAQVEVIDKKAEAIDKKTNQLQTEVDDVEGQIRNLQVGGRNYLLGSDKKLTGDGQYGIAGINTNFLNDNLGKQMTLSVRYNAENWVGGRFGFEIVVAYDDGATVFLNTMVFTRANTNGEATSSNIIQFPTEHGKVKSTYSALIVQGTTAGTISIYHPKLELGNKVTDWTPALEDLTDTPNRRRIIAIGDSYGADNGSYWTGWINCLKNIDNYDEIYGAGVGGAGFVNKTEGSNFLDILKSVNTGVDNNSITDIIVMGGYNDAAVSADRNAIYNAMKEFVSYANTKYPNAKLHLGFIAFNRFDSATQMRMDTYMGIYQQYGILAGFTFYRNLYFVLKRTSFVFNVSGNPNSGFHPNTDGNNEVALQALNCIRNGECHVHYGAVELGMNIYMDDGIYSFETTGQDSWGSQYMNNVAMPFNTPVECVDAKTLELVWAMQTATPFYINALLVDNTLKILTNVRVAFDSGKISYTNVGNTETVTPNNTTQFWFGKTNGVSWQNMF